MGSFAQPDLLVAPTRPNSANWRQIETSRNVEIISIDLQAAARIGANSYSNLVPLWAGGSFSPHRVDHHSTKRQVPVEAVHLCLAYICVCVRSTVLTCTQRI